MYLETCYNFSVVLANLLAQEVKVCTEERLAFESTHKEKTNAHLINTLSILLRTQEC